MIRLAGSNLGAAIAAGTLCVVSPAHASYVIDFQEVGSNVVMTSAGSINLAGLTAIGAGPLSKGATIVPQSAQVTLNPAARNINIYDGFSGPLSFGTSASSEAASSVFTHALLFAPAVVNWNGSTGRIGLATNYVSGASLGTNTATFAGSFASLGMTQGTYTWTWGSGATADSLTINIGRVTQPGAVPEPATWAMLILGFGILGGALRRRKRPALQYC